MKELSLIDKYPPQHYDAIREYIIKPLLGNHGENDLIRWFNVFIRKQQSLGNVNLNVDDLRRSIDSASWYYRGSRKYKGLMDIDRTELASMTYLKQHFGSKVDALLSRVRSSAVNLSGEPSFKELTHYTSIAEFCKDTIDTLTVIRAARAVHMLGIMNLTDLSLGLRYMLMGIPTSCDSDCYDRFCYRALTDLMRECLQRGVGMETLWDTWREKRLSRKKRLFWSAIRCTDRKQTELFLQAVFAKQKLVFEYLMFSSSSDLEAICRTHPDVDLILRGNSGILPVTRDLKLDIACIWGSSLLLDLLNIDVAALNGSRWVSGLVFPKPVRNQALTIEI